MSGQETSLGYAQLSRRSPTGDQRGTLFLTTRRLIWRTYASEVGAGAWLDVALEDLIRVGRVTGLRSPGVFGIRFRQDGAEETVIFCAQQPHRVASVKLAENLFRNLRLRTRDGARAA